MDVYDFHPFIVLLFGGLLVALSVLWFAYLSRPIKSRLTEEEKQILDGAFNFDGHPDE